MGYSWRTTCVELRARQPATQIRAAAYKSHFISLGATSLLGEQTRSRELEIRMFTSILLRSSGQHLNQARAVVLPLPSFHRAVIFAKTLYVGVAIHGLFMIGQKMVKKE